ncbi:hypothetical protein B0T26DRAFT_190595 [Lasiosphaeria miniovina]|uniref:Uncharacterized protein n=1 Tax=Lasiosphaeria miniovina TaxID=1954250 RepID=A0AA40E1P0_9PEZI|nr:uncharacterized protein B0T26DRAFT_190595 [Lasiosphaeria miniovina]KAK0721672.1 hypothetical protein B0T26DRAFT_190595 [Lasiosphaeria miniovina]
MNIPTIPFPFPPLLNSRDEISLHAACAACGCKRACRFWRDRYHPQWLVNSIAKSVLPPAPYTSCVARHILTLERQLARSLGRTALRRIHVQRALSLSFGRRTRAFMGKKVQHPAIFPNCSCNPDFFGNASHVTAHCPCPTALKIGRVLDKTESTASLKQFCHPNREIFRHRHSFQASETTWQTRSQPHTYSAISPVRHSINLDPHRQRFWASKTASET